MDISMHATVSCYDGPVGKSSYIIIDLVNEQVTHFVVEIKDDRREFLVPLDLMLKSDPHVILLDCNKEDVVKLTPNAENRSNRHSAVATALMFSEGGEAW